MHLKTIVAMLNVLANSDIIDACSANTVIQEMLDTLRTDNFITQEEYLQLWGNYLPMNEPNS